MLKLFAGGALLLERRLSVLGEDGLIPIQYVVCIFIAYIRQTGYHIIFSPA